MPSSGVSAPGRHTDTTPAQFFDTRPAILWFPQLSREAWFRTVGIIHARSMLPDQLFRLVKFLSQQRVDRPSGRVLGRWGYEEIDGGMQLAERYAAVHHLHDKAFWDDWVGLRSCGLAERVVRPAPGRKAVYALCLRVEVIPSGLPEDLARMLGVHQFPDPEPAEEEGAGYGHLSAAGDSQGWAEPVAVEVDVGTGPRSSWSSIRPCERTTALSAPASARSADCP